MATPMQYELVGKLLGALSANASGMRMRFDDDAVSLGGAEGKDILASWQQIATAIQDGVPLVDATPLWHSFAPMSHTGVTTYHPRQLTDLLKPWLNDVDNGFPKMPWPLAVFSCDLGGGELSMWCVADAAPIRADAAVLPHHLNGITNDRTYVVSRFAVSLVGGRLAATHIRAQPVVEWAGMNRWSLCTRLLLAYCNAKNASWVETSPCRATRRRSASVAGLRFRHIEIDMSRPKQKGRESGDGDVGVPWHHRRGHWAFYGADKPLFGRKGAHGWYWRPYMEVGDKKYGEIVQDYSISHAEAA